MQYKSCCIKDNFCLDSLGMLIQEKARLPWCEEAQARLNGEREEDRNRRGRGRRSRRRERREED
jgi:hypothetical protein